MRRYLEPNPADLTFFAADDAMRRMGLPGATAQGQLHLAGELDVPAFTHAVTALWRVFPVLAARRELNLFTGRPRWRLDGPRPDPRRVIRLHTLAEHTSAAVHAKCEDLLNTPLRAFDVAPLQFDIVRGDEHGDILLVRWPHALMDGRGYQRVLVELDRLFREQPDPTTLTSAGQEDRDDFGDLLRSLPWPKRRALLRAGLQPDTPRRKPGRQLALTPLPARPGRLRYVLRVLEPAEMRQVAQNAAQVCPDARLSDYLRATGLRALDELVRPYRGAPRDYTFMSYIDGRRTHPDVICHNFTVALPIAVPVHLAPHRTAVAAYVRQQMDAHRRAETDLREALSAWLTTRLPTAYLAALVRAAFPPGARPRPQMGVRCPMSLPFGLLGDFTPSLTTLCGQTLRHFYYVRTVVPQPGFGLDLQVLANRLAIVTGGLESRVPVPTLQRLLDRFIALLLTAD